MLTGPLACHQAILDSSLTSTQKLVLFGLHSHWSLARPAVFPSVPRLARLTSLSERTVRRSVADLEAIGVLAITRRQGQSNTHAMHFGALPLNPGHHVTPDTVSPLTELQGTPDTMAGPPLTPCPPKRSSEEIQGSDPGRPSKREPQPRRWRRVPETWTPNDAHRALATELGVDIDHELPKFRDHEFRDPKSDADATFRTWLRTAAQYQTSRSTTPASTRKSGDVYQYEVTSEGDVVILSQ